MKDVRSEKAAHRSLERADQGSDQPRPTGSLRPSDAAMTSPTPEVCRNDSPTMYEMVFGYSQLATQHCPNISTRFCPKSRSHTKHTTKPSLPGSRFAHFASRTVQRDAHCHARTSIANALSNRELHLLEPTLSHRKQMIAHRSNRELSTNRCRVNSHAVIPILTFLTGSGSRTEFAVTHSKQTTGTFLTGSRIGTLDPGQHGAGIDTSSRLAQHGAHSK